MASCTKTAATVESTPPETADDIIVFADDCADFFDLFRDKLRRCPIAFAFANIEKKISQNLFAERRVRNFGVKLHGVNVFFAFSIAVTTFAGRRRLLKTFGQVRNVVAVAHPNVEFKRQIVEKVRFRRSRRLSFACPYSRLSEGATSPPKSIGEKLHPVTNSENRRVNFFVKIAGNLRRVLVHKLEFGPPERITPFGLLFQNFFQREMKRHDLAINALLTHAPGDKLRILRAKIEN